MSNVEEIYHRIALLDRRDQIDLLARIADLLESEELDIGGIPNPADEELEASLREQLERIREGTLETTPYSEISAPPGETTLIADG